MSYGHAGYAGYVVDHPSTAEFKTLIGAAILNFGMTEMLVIELAEIVSRDSTQYQKALSLLFTKRAELVRTLTKKSKLSQELKKRLLTELSRAEDLAKIRNELAHNPCMLVWNKKDNSGPPDAIGIPAMKTMKGKPTRQVHTIPIAALKLAVDQLALGAQGLSKVRDDVKAALDGVK
jgi:hypothetical protein